MARKRSRPRPAEPEDESQAAPEREERVETPAEGQSGKGVTKADACRAALAAGIDTTEDAVFFVKARFGIDIKPTEFSLYKSKEKKKRQDRGAPKGRSGGRRPKPQ